MAIIFDRRSEICWESNLHGDQELRTSEPCNGGHADENISEFLFTAESGEVHGKAF